MKHLLLGFLLVWPLSVGAQNGTFETIEIENDTRWDHVFEVELNGRYVMNLFNNGPDWSKLSIWNLRYLDIGHWRASESPTGQLPTEVRYFTPTRRGFIQSWWYPGKYSRFPSAYSYWNGGMNHLENANIPGHGYVWLHSMSIDYDTKRVRVWGQHGAMDGGGMCWGLNDCRTEIGASGLRTTSLSGPEVGTVCASPRGKLIRCP